MIKVLIRRRVKQGKWNDYQEVVNRVRSEVETFQGFISGEVMTSLTEQANILVIATWRSQQDWEAWLSSEARAKLLKGLENILEETEEVECFVVQN